MKCSYQKKKKIGITNIFYLQYIHQKKNLMSYNGNTTVIANKMEEKHAEIVKILIHKWTYTTIFHIKHSPIS